MKGMLRPTSMLVLAAALLHGAPSLAQDPTLNYGNSKLDATGVGVSGGVIVGAELVAAVEAIIGVEKLWPYLVFPAIGGAGGGVGGYYLENASPEGAVALLVSGLALVVPTLIGVTAARAYDPEKEKSNIEDEGGAAVFSFEKNPEETALPPEPESTTTDVEAKPEGAPDNLPPPGTDAAPGETAPAPAPAPETPPAGESEPPKGSGGALLFMSSRGEMRLGMPIIDIRPAVVAGGALDGRTRTGIEILVPLLHIDLP